MRKRTSPPQVSCQDLLELLKKIPRRNFRSLKTKRADSHLKDAPETGKICRHKKTPAPRGGEKEGADAVSDIRGREAEGETK